MNYTFKDVSDVVEVEDNQMVLILDPVDMLYIMKATDFYKNRTHLNKDEWLSHFGIHQSIIEWCIEHGMEEDDLS